MPFHYPSFDKHFSSLSKHDKSSVFLHIGVEVRACRKQTDTKYTTKSLSIAQSEFKNLAGKFGRLIP